MDEDSGDWGMEEKKSEEPVASQRGNRGRNAGPVATKKEASPKERNKLDESDWLDRPEENIPQASGRVRGKAVDQNEQQFNSPAISNLPPPKRETTRTELKPDQQENSWMNDDKQQQQPKSRGNRGERRDKQSETGDPPKRGNRNNREGQTHEADFKKKSHFEQDQQLCSEASNSGRNENWGYQNGGYRGGRGRGRGGEYGYRGGYRGNNDRQEEQAPRGNRQYMEKDNHYNPKYQNNNQYRNNNQYDNRRNNQDNRDNRDFNNDRYEKPYQSSSSNQTYQDNRKASFSSIQSSQEPMPSPAYNAPKQDVIAFQPPPVNWESSNVCDTSFQVLASDEKAPKQVVIVRDKGVTPVPRGRKTWPQASIHIQKCKMTITYRQINEFACKMLVLPYVTTKMQYYPRNIINSSSFDYRKKILQKTAKSQEISKPGAVYLQKAVEVGSFVALAFLKIDVGRLEESLKTGVKQVLRLAESLQRQQLDSIVFPICPQLGNAGWVVRPLLDNLQNCRKLRQFYVTTNQPSCFISAVKEFTLKVEQLLNENEIYIN